jgi:hypothetical protein
MAKRHTKKNSLYIDFHILGTHRLNLDISHCLKSTPHPLCRDLNMCTELHQLSLLPMPVHQQAIHWCADTVQCPLYKLFRVFKSNTSAFATFTDVDRKTVRQEILQ